MGTTWSFGKPGDANEQLSAEDAASTLQLIESLLENDTESDLPSDNTIKLSLGEVMDLIPAEYVVQKPETQVEREKPVPIVIDDLFAQLAGGKIVTSVARLAFSVPADMVDSRAATMDKAMVTLPLPRVVAVIDPQLMARKKAQMYRRYKISNLKDPFKRFEKPPQVPMEDAVKAAESLVVGPAAGSAPESAKPQTATAPATPPVVSALPEPPAVQPPPVIPVVQAPAPPPVPAPVATPAVKKPVVPRKKKGVPEGMEDSTEDAALADKLGGVNINTASVEQLMTIDGMTNHVAEKIMEFRATRGAFKSVFDLCEVPGIGKTRFRKITGITWNRRRIHRIWKLALLLDMPVADAARLQAVAQALAVAGDTLGCILSDGDGLVLAESKIGQEAERIGAVVPRLVQQAADNLKAAGFESSGAITLSAGDKTFAVAGCGRIFVTCVCKKHGMKKRQLVLLEKTAVELGWLLSHRGYVGRAAQA